MSACMYVSLKLDTFLMQQEKNIYWKIKGNKQVLLRKCVHSVFMGIQGASKAMQWSKCLLLLVPSVLLIVLCVIYFANLSGDDASVRQSVQKAPAAEADPRTQYRRHYLEEEEVRRNTPP